MKQLLNPNFSFYKQLIGKYKRHLSLILLVFTFINHQTFAQSIIWDKVTGTKEDDTFTTGQPTLDGGYIMGSTSTAGIGGDKSEASRDTDIYNRGDYWVVKLNANRTKAWDKTIGGNGRDVLAFLRQTPDGGYILGGTSRSGISNDKTEATRDTTNVAYTKGDFWIVKLNADGTKAWDKTFGGFRNDNLTSLQQTSDGGFILGGYSSSGIGGDKSEPSRGDADYWIVKLKADGSKEWDKTLGGNSNDLLACVLQTRDGNYVLHGYTYSEKSSDKSEGSRGEADYWVVKINKNGAKIWDKTYGGRDGDEVTLGANLLKQTSDGGFIIGGSSLSSKGGDKTQARRGLSDYWVLKLNADGSKVWDTTVGGNNGEGLQSLLALNDGSYILGGSSNSKISNDKSEDNKGLPNTEDYWVVKLGTDGKFLSDKTIGGNNSDWLSSLDMTSDRNLILLGNSRSGKNNDKTQASKGGSDAWLVKLENDFKQNQKITFDSIPMQELGEPAISLSAKVNTGLPITFEVLSGSATIKGNKLILTGAGTVRVAAIQAGNAQYKRTETTQTVLITLTGKQWQKNYGGNKTDVLTTIIATPDGGHIIGGTSTSGASGDKTENNKGNTDYWVAKVNATGVKIWDKTFGGSQADQLTAMLATTDGNYLLGGTSGSGKSGDKSLASKGLNDYWLVKIDANGNKIWDKTFGGSQNDWLATLTATPDGGYVLGGTSNSGKSGDKSQASHDTQSEVYTLGDYWILKINAAGNKVWDKSYGGKSQDKLTAILPKPNGYLLGGRSSSDTSGDKTQKSRGLVDYWVISITEQGDKIWDNTYGGLTKNYNGKGIYEDGASLLSSMVATSDGGFLLGGSSNAAKGGEKTDDVVTREPNSGSFHTANYDYWVIKINSSGKKIWDKTYGGRIVYPGEIGTGEFWTNTGDSYLNRIVPTTGGFLLAGTSNADIDRSKSEKNRSNISKNEDERREQGYRNVETSVWNDCWLVKIDEQGKVLEDRTIGGPRNDELSAAILTPQGNLLLGGTSYSGIGADKNSVNVGEADYWIVQVSADRILEPLAASWDHRYGASRNEGLTDVIKTADGGYLSAGFSDSYSNSDDKTQNSIGKYDYWLVKTDKNGKRLWDKVYGGLEDDYLNRVIQTQDGGYLLAGSSLSGKSGDKSQATQGNRDYWIIKIDAQGTKQWDKTYGGSGTDELQKVIQLASGNYVLGGYSNSPISGDKSQVSQGKNDYWFVKISKSGKKIWDKTYGGNQDETLGSFTETQDDGFLLAGTSLSGVSGDKSQPTRGSSDFWVVKTDKDGNLLWEKTYGGSGQDEAYSIARSGPEYYISGTSNSSKNGDKSQASQGSKDYWLVKIDANGTKLWDKTFGGNQDDELRASTRLRNGHLVLGGTSFSSISGNKTQLSRGISDYWIVEVDAAGNQVYDKRFGGSGQEELRTIFQTIDGGLLLAGRSNSTVSGEHSQTSWGLNDFWLVKLAPENPSMVAARETTPTEEPITLTNYLTTYPNPFQGKVTVKFSLPQTQTATVKIFDSHGQEVCTLFQEEAKAKQTYQVEWQAGNKPAGLYFLQLQTPTLRQQHKLLLTK
ncbi:hypothetical protein AHMF7605_10705 [Adhaeribacter arboris]|uniref:Secretion system C-terminal sorting domain-containing protein n=1 Tax=Adhaeribacter arboris TaxID=2072846 RepID=A0A2T2YEL9_9BACT|nr:T9SS type A sorting domain-containing protein [Adhaeribacter arboris]PSR53954.1 hypothetical protein AHMF7605_10705 [Adhaeribacter arboris]